MDSKQLMILDSYSRQLVRQANQTGQLEAFLAEIKSLVKLFDKDALEHFLAQRVIPDEEKRQVLQLIIPNCSSITAGFFQEVMVKRHYDLVYPILQEVLHQTQYTTGQFDMVVRSVVPVTEQQLVRMKDLVRQKLKLGIRDVTEVLDDTLLGGFVIEINHKVIDASVKHQLQVLKQKIR